MAVYADLADLEEDKRIDLIGKAVMHGPKTSGDRPLMAGFMVEDDAKADRYIEKLQKKFPGIRIVDRTQGPIAGMMVTVRVSGPLR